jgi:hypothetical protein
MLMAGEKDGIGPPQVWSEEESILASPANKIKKWFW